jgi:hypothetical protein
MPTTLSELNAANKAAAKAAWHQKKAQTEFEAAARALDAAKAASSQANRALDACIADLDPSVAAGL